MVIVEQKIKGVKIAYRESHASFVRVGAKRYQTFLKDDLSGLNILCY